MACEETFYDAPYGQKAHRIVRIIFILLLIITLIIIVDWIYFYDSRSEYSFLLYLYQTILSVCVIVMIFIVYLYSTRGYYILDRKIIVDRLGPKKKIMISNIKKISYVPYAKYHYFYPTLRFGLFGYCGNFNVKGIGKLKAYCRRWEHLVLIKTDDNKIFLLAPESPQVFIEEVKTNMEKKYDSL